MIRTIGWSARFVTAHINCSLAGVVHRTLGPLCDSLRAGLRPVARLHRPAGLVTRGLAREQRDWGRENVAFQLAVSVNRTILSLPQSASLTAPSSEGALVHRILYTAKQSFTISKNIKSIIPKRGEVCNGEKILWIKYTKIGWESCNNRRKYGIGSVSS